MRVTDKGQDGKEARRILIGMIVDDTVTNRVSQASDKLNDDEQLFTSKWANLITGWILKYFRKYGTAPRREIEPMFESWASRSKDKATIELVERFVRSLSEEYEREGTKQTEYLCDLASAHFNSVRLLAHATKLQGLVDRGKLKEADSSAMAYNRIDIGSTTDIDVFQDKDAIKEVFAEKQPDLIRYPGAVGEFFKGALGRDCFVAIQAPEKRGKTWMLMDMAWMGAIQRRKVVFFSVGDMSQLQMMERLVVRAAQKPLYPCEVTVPIEMKLSKLKDDEGRWKYNALLKTKRKRFKKSLGWGSSVKGFQEILRTQIKSKTTMFRLSTHPGLSIGVDGIRGKIQEWARNGWVPDIIVVDYADILAPPSGVRETRDQINQTWIGLRSLSQTFHCLVLTATQADAASYDVKTQGMKNFSNDKRKHGHVTAEFGLNQTEDEEDRGILRFNWLVRRGAKINKSQCVNVAGCLDLSRPVIKSCW